ncbi:MAG TPA: sensor histidine kinase [Opitutaceae bacterium]
MNPLPRLLALGIFIVLVMLATVLGVSAWPRSRPGPVTTAPAPAQPAAGTAVEPGGAPPDVRGARVTRFQSRLAFALVLLAVVLAVALLTSLSFKPLRANGNASRPPFAVSRAEMTSLEHLAKASIAQGAALARERDERQRVEQEAYVRQLMIDHALEEKIRLGRDLHDGMIQSLYATGLTLESAKDLLRRDPTEAERRLDTSLQMVNATIKDVRAYIAGLSPHNVRRDHVATALTSVTEELRAGRDVAFEFKIDDSAAARLTGDQVAQTVQVVREAVSNALRHGEARQITVRLHEGDRAVCVAIQDDGRGFTVPKHDGGGHGLANMRARAEAAGGDLQLTSAPGAGTRVVLTLPVHSSV